MAELEDRAWRGRRRREGKAQPNVISQDQQERLLEDAADALHAVFVDIENGECHSSVLKDIINVCHNSCRQ